MLEGFAKSEGRRIVLRSILFSVLVLLLAAAGAYFLYLDFHDLGPAGTGPVAGKIEKCDLRVRRKTNRSYLWSNAEPNENLFFQDSVQTGNESSALIELEDGNQIELGENSLIVIDRFAELPLQFIQGSAVLYRNGKEEKLSQGENGKIKIEEATVRLLKPESLAQRFLFGDEKKTVIFSWMQTSGTAPESYRLEISSTKRFEESTVNHFETKDSSFSVPMDAGKYFWRIQSGTSFSSIRQLLLIRIDLPKLVYPAEREILKVSEDARDIQFRWYQEVAEEGEPQNAFLDLSPNENFKPNYPTSVDASHGIASIKLPDEFSHQSLEEPIYWRIRAEYKGLSVQSEARTFFFTGWGGPAPVAPIVAAIPSQTPKPQVSPSLSPSPTPSSSPSPSPSPSLPLELPALMTPEVGFQFKLVDRTHPPLLTWSEVKGASQYEVALYFKDAPTAEGVSNKWKRIIHVKTKKLTYRLVRPQVGSYSYTIRVLGDQVPESPYSPLREFSVIYDVPLNAPEIISPEAQ